MTMFNAVIVGLHCSLFSLSRTDRQKSRELNRENNAAPDAARLTKTMGGGAYKTILDRPGRIVKKTTGEIEQRSAPYARGQRIVPTSLFQEIRQIVQSNEEDFWDAVRDVIELFGTKRDSFIESERRRQGGWFNEADYPDATVVRTYYKWELDVAPVPESGHFMVELMNEDREWIKTQFRESQMRMLARSHERLVARVSDHVHNMVGVLTRYTKGRDGKLGSRLNKSLVDKLKEDVRVMPSLNELFGDPRIGAVMNEVATYLTKYSVDDIKGDDHVRMTVLRHAQRIAKMFDDIEAEPFEEIAA